MDNVRVLIADDETLVRKAMRFFLESESGIQVIGEAINGLEAVVAAEEMEPDVVLMDLRMPEMNGVEATVRLFQKKLRTAVLALTTFSSEKHVVSALRAGASGYLIKDSTPEEFVKAVRDVSQGKPVVPAHVTNELIASLRVPTGADLNARRGGLTDRELLIVKGIAAGKSNAEISQQVHLAEPTVKAALGSVMKKWAVRNRVEVLIHAVTHGVVDLNRGRV